jgi:hypothetical protein
MSVPVPYDPDFDPPRVQQASGMISGAPAKVAFILGITIGTTIICLLGIIFFLVAKSST